MELSLILMNTHNVTGNKAKHRNSCTGRWLERFGSSL